MAIKEILYQNNKFIISYNMIDNNASQYMVFLHGWGSNKELMALSFSKYFHQYNHVYIDLPGFGASPNEVFLTTKDYACIITLFLQAMKVSSMQKLPVIVGHSFGGKIALLLDYEVILLSSAGILLPKPLKVRLKIAIAKILKKIPLHFNFLRATDAKNLSPIMYEIFKHVVQEDFAQHYKDCMQKTTIFWGKDDKATPLQAYHIICTLMPHARTHILEGDHYFFLQQGSVIEKLYYDDANMPKS